MNIVFITAALGLGGAEKMLVFVANSLFERGHQISIINLHTITDYEEKQTQNIHNEIRVYDIPGEGKNFLKRISQLISIKKIAKENKADVIVGFKLFPNLYAKLAGLMINVPSIMSERGDPYRTLSGGLLSKSLVSIINGSSGGVFQTEGAKEFYGKGLQKRGVVIPNPIFIKGDIPEVKQSEREKTVVSVGRIGNLQKRYDVMIDAFAIFNKKHPEYILKLYGDGPDVENVQQWIKEKNITDSVKFMGLTKQPMQDIAKDGMFLITSDFEGISNSLLEAMAVGLPCVSTDHSPGGARLLIQDHENGLLAPIADAQKLADAMCEFADNQELAEKCGNNAKDVVNRFAPSKIVDQWENYICRIINK